ncbi:MAG: cysteine rich repeat-containing protein [Caulobacteraceae bacterium]|nr:cysteine rich repeat-containing protein [Caulobacteraceae bacterium]
MKYWIVAGAALAIAGSAYGVGVAQQREGGGPMAGLRQACRADVQKLCSDVQPGGGRLMQCMRDHRDQLSNGCKSMLVNAHGHRPGGQDGSPPATPSPQG